MTKVSIIIPCYNQAKYLAQAVDSCLAQTHAEVEIVIVDDGSPDDTPTVAARYRDRANVRYIRQENTGLGGARNRGIQASTGEYLCFLDSDDWYLPEKIARQVALLDANPELGWTYCDIVSVDEAGQPSAEGFSVAQAQRLLSGDVFDSLLLCGYFPPHTVMIRRRVLNQVGEFDATLGGYADYDLWLRVAGAGWATVFVPERLAVYRVHAASMSKDGQHMGEVRRAALRKILALHPDRVAAGLAVLQQRVTDLHATGEWLASRVKEVPAPPPAVVDPGFEQYARLTITWRAKLEAGKALAGLKEGPLAARLMIEAVKSIEGSKNPRVILEALTEVPLHLAALDPGRATYLLEMAVKLATNLNQPALRDRAAEALARLRAPSSHPAPLGRS